MEPTRLNYAEALEREAYDLARRQLIKALPDEDQQSAALARLDLIHAQRMELAAAWTQPRMRRPLSAAEVLPAAVEPLARGLATAAKADE